MASAAAIGGGDGWAVRWDGSMSAALAANFSSMNVTLNKSLASTKASVTSPKAATVTAAFCPPHIFDDTFAFQVVRGPPGPSSAPAPGSNQATPTAQLPIPVCMMSCNAAPASGGGAFTATFCRVDNTGGVQWNGPATPSSASKQPPPRRRCSWAACSNQIKHPHSGGAFMHGGLSTATNSVGALLDDLWMVKVVFGTGANSTTCTGVKWTLLTPQHVKPQPPPAAATGGGVGAAAAVHERSISRRRDHTIACTDTAALGIRSASTVTPVLVMFGGIATDGMPMSHLCYLELDGAEAQAVGWKPVPLLCELLDDGGDDDDPQSASQAPTARSHHAFAILPDGTAFLGGGVDREGRALCDLWRIELRFDTLLPARWLRVDTTLSVPRHLSSCTVQSLLGVNPTFHVLPQPKKIKSSGLKPGSTVAGVKLTQVRRPSGTSLSPVASSTIQPSPASDAPPTPSDDAIGGAPFGTFTAFASPEVVITEGHGVPSPSPKVVADIQPPIPIDSPLFVIVGGVNPVTARPSAVVAVVTASLDSRFALSPLHNSAIEGSHATVGGARCLLSRLDSHTEAVRHPSSATLWWYGGAPTMAAAHSEASLGGGTELLRTFEMQLAD